jgi:hypothetical protein
MKIYFFYFINKFFPKFVSIKTVETLIDSYIPSNLNLRYRKLIRKIISKIKRTLFKNQVKYESRNDETIWINGFPSNSLSSQDLFVLTKLKGKENGTYFEIGAGWHKRINNTFVLEKFFNWTGISIDIDSNLVEIFNVNRRNKCIKADALKTDYFALLQKNDFPNVIDYLSLDIDPAIQTLRVLRVLPFDTYNFKVITFEHDSYSSGNTIKYLARMFLSKSGYRLEVKDVVAKSFGKYEDWWLYAS